MIDRIIYISLFSLWTLILSVLMLLPGDQITGFMFFEGEDKILHLGVFMLWGGLLTLALKVSGTQKWLLYKIIIAALIFGVSIELAQTFVPNRQMDLFDITMNISGAIVGYFSVNYLKKELIGVNKKFDK